MLAHLKHPSSFFSLTSVGASIGACLAMWANSARADVKTWEDVYRSAYSLGRGGTGISNADGEDAIFYNPAGMAQGTGIFKEVVIASPQVEVSRSAATVARQVNSNTNNAVDTVEQNLGKPTHIGVSNFTGVILRRAALGAIASSNLDLLAYDDPKNGGLQSVHASADETLGMTFTVADKFMEDHLLIGVNGKYLQRSRGDITGSAADIDALKAELKDRSSYIGTGTGTGADFGIMLVGKGPARPQVGLTVDDIGNTHISSSKKTDLDLGLKQTVNAGASIEPGTPYSRIKLLIDYRDITSSETMDYRLKLHIGGEISVLDHIGITGGLNQGYPTAGFYVDLYLARLDLGVYTQETGTAAGTRPDTRYFTRLKLGVLTAMLKHARTISATRTALTGRWSVFLSAGLMLHCGSNYLKGGERHDPAVDACLALEQNNPTSAINTLESALVKSPGTGQYLSILATAYANRAGIDILKLAAKIGGTESSGTSATTATTNSTNDLVALFGYLPTASTAVLADIDYAVNILTKQMINSAAQPGDKFKTAIYLTASMALHLKALDALGTGDLTAADIANLSAATATTLLTELEAAASVLSGQSGATEQTAATAITKYQTQINAAPGSTDQEKLQNYLTAHAQSSSSGS